MKDIFKMFNKFNKIELKGLNPNFSKVKLIL